MNVKGLFYNQCSTEHKLGVSENNILEDCYLKSVRGTNVRFKDISESGVKVVKSKSILAFWYRNQNGELFYAETRDIDEYEIDSYTSLEDYHELMDRYYKFKADYKAWELARAIYNDSLTISSSSYHGQFVGNENAKIYVKGDVALSPSRCIAYDDINMFALRDSTDIGVISVGSNGAKGAPGKPGVSNTSPILSYEELSKMRYK